MGSPSGVDPNMAGNFLVSIDGVLTNGSFSAVTGLEASIDVVDYRGGEQKENGTQKLPGLNRFTDVTLKRGLTKDLTLWNWINSGLQGNVTRANMTITLFDQARNPVIVWKLTNTWPCKWRGPVLTANSSEVAIEELEICYEGLEMTVSG